MAEPLQQVPIFNLILHWAVFLTSVSAFAIAFYIWLGNRNRSAMEAAGYWRLVMFGLLFYALSEFSDLYTPGLKASLGVHNYLTEQLLLVGFIFLFIAIYRLIGEATRRSEVSTSAFDSAKSFRNQ